MTRWPVPLLLCALLLLCACTDVPPTPRWDAPVPAPVVMRVTTPMSGPELGQADLGATSQAAGAVLQQVAATVYAGTVQAAGTDSAQQRAVQATWGALSMQAAFDAGTATHEALVESYAATARAGDASVLETRQAAHVSATAGVLAATDTAQARTDAATLAGYVQVGTGLRELGTGVGALAVCAGVPILLLTAAFALVDILKQRESLDTSSGVPLRWHAGRWERVPEYEASVVDDEEPPAVPRPPISVNGVPRPNMPPIGPPATAEQRALTLELIDAVREYVAEHPEWPASQLPGWRRLRGWYPGPWSEVRGLLSPYHTGADGEVKTLRRGLTWDMLRDMVAAGAHLTTTPLPRPAAGQGAGTGVGSNG